jgi:UDP-3-O-[3-hydroxymyristoyl] glucosamine N-acyltransferase
VSARAAGEGRRSISAAEIAALTGGRLIGPGSTTASRVAPLDRAGPGDLSFLASPRYLSYFHASRAAVVLVADAMGDPGTGTVGPTARVLVADPHRALLAVLPVLYPPPEWAAGVHPTAIVGRGATWQDPVAIGSHVVLGAGVRLGRHVRIGAACVLEDGVQVGDDTELAPGVICYRGTEIGNRVILHAGVRIGTDGFGYVPGSGGAAHRKIPHVGRCLIGDDVEIGANSCVDRGSVDDTVVGPGTKIDNLVHVAHNVRIGARCLIMAQVGIAGSSRIGDDVILGGQVGIIDHLTVGQGARVLAQCGVMHDVPPGETVWWTPARPHREVLRALAALFKLPGLLRQLEQVPKHAEKPDGRGA